MHVLIVEDEEKLAQSLKKGLEQEGFSVDYILDGEEAEKRISIHNQDYDLIILDVMLPKVDGVTLCKEVRKQGVLTPILMLTGRDGMDDKVVGLEAGADDYLVKPFAFAELLARVRALLRRPHESLPQKLEAAGVVLDPAKRRVSKNGREVDLTLKEFELLEYLMRNRGRAVDREQIFSHVWDFASDSFSNVVDVHIKNLRKKIGERNHGKQLIETIRGVGYRLAE